MLSAKLYFRRTKYENTSWGNSVMGSLELNSHILGTISRVLNYATTTPVHEDIVKLQ